MYNQVGHFISAQRFLVGQLLHCLGHFIFGQAPLVLASDLLFFYFLEQKYHYLEQNQP